MGSKNDSTHVNHAFEKDAKKADMSAISRNQVSPLPDKELSPSLDGASSTSSEEIDPWDVVKEVKFQTPFNELTTCGKVLRVTLYTTLAILAFLLLYLFICSIDLLGASFQLMAGRTAGEVFNNSELLNNPICCLMIGVGVTVLLQSSSTSTSIIVTMVGAKIIPVENAIYIIMGTNIGTTVTNTIVSLGQIGDRTEFRRAFAAATVHDCFNWLAVLVLLPLEVASHILEKLTAQIVLTIDVDTDITEPQFLKVITEPLTTAIVRVDKSVVYASADYSIQKKRPLARYLCDEEVYEECYDYPNGTFVEDEQLIKDIYSSTEYPYYWASNNRSESATRMLGDTCFANASTGIGIGDQVERYFVFITNFSNPGTERCSHWFTGAGLPSEDVVRDAGVSYKYLDLSDGGAGALVFVLAIVMLCSCLVFMVKILSYLLNGPLLKVVRGVINYEGTYVDKNGVVRISLVLRELVGYGCILIGAGLTILVQSSSVFTSTMTPLVGMGIITVERMYPLTLGSNIGTTITGIIAGFTSPPETIRDALQVSFAHLFFNIFGICIYYPIFFMRRLPIRGAKYLGNIVADYRWFAIAYLLSVFFIFPTVIIALSVPGWYVLFGVALPFIIILIAVIVINTMQNHCSNALPKVLRTWDFLPVWLRSLEPYDRVFRKMCGCCKTCQVQPEEDPKLEPITIVVDAEVKMGMKDGALKETTGSEPSSPTSSTVNEQLSLTDKDKKEPDEPTYDVIADSTVDTNL